MCYAEFVASSTTRIRIPDDLKLSLEKTARRMNKGKNWIIKQALAESAAPQYGLIAGGSSAAVNRGQQEEVEGRKVLEQDRN